jgi:ATP-dependent DNA helicase RecG
LSYPGPIPPVDSQILQNKKIEARDYRNRRIGDFLKELDLTEGRGSGFPKIYKEMRKNGSPEPIIYTDEQRILFLTTLPVHPLLLEQEIVEVSKQVSKGVSKHDDVEDKYKSLNFKTLDDIITFSNGVGNTVSNGVNAQESDQVTKQVTKEVTKEIDLQLSDKQKNNIRKLINTTVSPFAENILNFLNDAPLSKREILEMLKLSNQTKNKERHIDPLMNCGWVAYTIPDNPKDMNQRYQLTDAGKRLLGLMLIPPKAL